MSGRPTGQRPIRVYTLDPDGKLQARDLTPDEAEMALRLHMVLARLPDNPATNTRRVVHPGDRP